MRRGTVSNQIMNYRYQSGTPMSPIVQAQSFWKTGVTLLKVHRCFTFDISSKFYGALTHFFTGTKPGDVYSCGIIIHEILERKGPYGSSSDDCYLTPEGECSLFCLFCAPKLPKLVKE